MDRREFVGGGLAAMMGMLLGVPTIEAEAMMQQAEENPDDALVFLIDGTKDAPLIRVEGVIKAIEFNSNRDEDYDDVYSDGVMYQRFLREPTFTTTFKGPFTMKFIDEKKFWGKNG